MNAIVPMPSTEGRCWLGKVRRVILLLCVVSLIGCGTTPVTARLPEPAADLMTPVPTGSEVLQRATANTQTWLKMLHDGPTR